MSSPALPPVPPRPAVPDVSRAMPSGGVRRRSFLCALGGSCATVGVQASMGDATAEALLRRGGVVIAFRHALAPGTFDPPGFRLDDCSTQRNLDDEGRAQARRIGQWFQARGLAPREVSSSPWCRCIDTATLAFGRARSEPALGSPRGDGVSAGEAAAAQRRLRRALVAASSQPGFAVWVTHMFVLADLTGESVASAGALVLRAPSADAVQVLARFEPR